MALSFLGGFQGNRTLATAIERLQLHYFCMPDVFLPACGRGVMKSNKYNERGKGEEGRKGRGDEEEKIPWGTIFLPCGN